MSETPLVAVIMGSKSDWETMRHADEILTRLGVPHECAIVSAHRTPAWMAEYAAPPRGAVSRSSLPARAAPPTCPGWWPRTRSCRFSECPSKPRRSRESTRCSRSCRCRAVFPSGRSPSAWRERPMRRSSRRDPVAKHGRRIARRRSAHFETSKRRRFVRTRCRDQPHPPRARPSACSAAGSSAACSPSPRGAWGTGSIRFRRTATRRPARWPTWKSPRRTKTSTPCGTSRAGVAWSPSNSRTSRLPRPQAAAEEAPVRPGGPRAAHDAAPAAREDVSRRRRAFRSRPSCQCASLEDLRQHRAARPPRRAQDGGLRLRRQGSGPHCGSPTDAADAWQQAGGQASILEAFVDFEREISVVAARGLDGSFAH